MVELPALRSDVALTGKVKPVQGESPMKPNILLIIASVLSILLMTIHLTQDILRDEGGMASYVFAAVPVLVVWLYGALLLAGRRSGYVIMLVGSIIAAAMPVMHVMGAGSLKARTHGAFFVWTLMALGVTGIFSLVLSVRGLWNPQWGESGQP
jgi:hypothetical protein